MLLQLEYGYRMPRSNMGVVPDPFILTETDELILFRTAVPGLSDKHVSVKVRNNNKLVIRSLIADVFSPKFKYVFLLPDNVLKEDINAFIIDGILNVKLIKNK